MNANEPQFWMMITSIVIAVGFFLMAMAMIAIAVSVRRVTITARRLEQRIEPLIEKVDAISLQGKEISEHIAEVSLNLATATRYLAESTELIKDEVADLRQIVGQTALVAKDKVEMVSRTIDRTHDKVANTTDFVHSKIVEPAREIAAIMAGLKRGLEVLFAPAPKQIDRVYVEEDMFIG